MVLGARARERMAVASFIRPPVHSFFMAFFALPMRILAVKGTTQRRAKARRVPAKRRANQSSPPFSVISIYFYNPLGCVPTHLPRLVVTVATRPSHTDKYSLRAPHNARGRPSSPPVSRLQCVNIPPPKMPSHLYTTPHTS